MSTGDGGAFLLIISSSADREALLHYSSDQSVAETGGWAGWQIRKCRGRTVYTVINILPSQLFDVKELASKASDPRYRRTA